MNHRLHRRRKVIGALFFIGIIVLFLSGGKTSPWFGWMADIQFIPALLALNAIALAIILAITLIFGRLYCSTICPLGVLQDIIYANTSKKKNKINARQWSKIVWLVIAIAFIVALEFGLTNIALLIEPYSSFGRMVTAFSDTTGTVMGIAAVSFIILIWITAWGGRWYCNNICPVGAILGVIGQFSLFKMRINTDKCNHCGNCGRKCKASCIDSKNQKIDYMRCVACMNCIGDCKQNAISYSMPTKKKAEKPTNDSRRAFMTGVGALSASYAMAQTEKIKEAVAVVKGEQPHKNNIPLKPAGALSLVHFSRHCTACQLCVSVCLKNVLRPSRDLSSFMQPELDFSHGYCDVDCNKCAEICPTDAIRPISLEDKTVTQIGHAIAFTEYCINKADKNTCTKCEDICPAGAVSLVEKNGRMIPAIDEEFCIGCGACEFHCHAYPVKAILIEGHEVHKEV